MRKRRRRWPCPLALAPQPATGKMLRPWSQQARQLTPRRGTVAHLGNPGCVHIHTGNLSPASRVNPKDGAEEEKAEEVLAFTRDSFTSRLLCTNRLSYHSPRPPALPTLVQYYCTTIGQYTTPLPTSRLYTIHHTRLVMTISCEGQRGWLCPLAVGPQPASSTR